MKVTVEFNMDNADFDYNPEPALRRLFEKAVEFITDETTEVGILRDINGNKVGTVTVEGYL